VKNPQKTPSKNMPASAKITPNGRVSNMNDAQYPHHAAIIITPGFTREQSTNETGHGTQTRNDITTPYIRSTHPAYGTSRAAPRLEVISRDEDH